MAGKSAKSSVSGSKPAGSSVHNFASKMPAIDVCQISMVLLVLALSYIAWGFYKNYKRRAMRLRSRRGSSCTVCSRR